MKELSWEISHEGCLSVGVSYHRLDFLRNKIVNHSKGATCSCVISIDRTSFTVGSLNLDTIKSKELRKNTWILVRIAFMYKMNTKEMDLFLTMVEYPTMLLRISSTGMPGWMFDRESIFFVLEKMGSWLMWGELIKLSAEVSFVSCEVDLQIFF